MNLHTPLIITSRLMPGVRVAGATISLDLGPRNSEGRTVYQCWLDLPDGTEHEITDLQSGCGGGDIQDGIASLLSFLGAAAESRQYREFHSGSEVDPDSNEGLFAPGIVDWAAEHADDIGMLACEIEEAPGLVEV